MKPILVTSYISPDLDGVASAIAYAEFLNKTGRESVAGIMGEMHFEAQWVLEKSGALFPFCLNDTHGYERIVLVDTSNMSMQEGKLKPESVIEIIDHRVVHEADQFPKAKIQIERVGAAATLIAERFMKDSVLISRVSALLLYGTIASNTLNFKGAVVSERDRLAFRWLAPRACADDAFVREMFLAKSDQRGARLALTLWSDYVWYDFGGRRICIAQIEMLGARELATTRKADIFSELRRIKKEKDAEMIFLNIIDLEADGNLFVAEESETQALLSQIFNVAFAGGVALYSSLLQRKEIVAKLKAVLEQGAVV